MKQIVFSLASRLRRVELEVANTLARLESSKARIMTLDQSRKRLQRLSVDQEALIQQSISCIEFGFCRAAIVMAWAALMDYLHERIVSDKFIHLNRVRPSWNIRSLDDIRDNYSDRAIIDALEKTSLFTKSIANRLRALLVDRNEAAHPSPTDPDTNEALGFLSKTFRQIEQLQKRSF